MSFAAIGGLMAATLFAVALYLIWIANVPVVPFLEVVVAVGCIDVGMGIFKSALKD